jgi:hypothetical protein
VSAIISSDLQREQVRALASRGVPLEVARHLAGYLPDGKLLPRARFARLYQQELARGAAEADAAVAGALFELATSGKSVQATLAWAKQRLGWSSQATTAGDDDNKNANSHATGSAGQQSGAEALAVLRTLLDEIATRKAADGGAPATLAATGAGQSAAAAASEQK